MNNEQQAGGQQQERPQTQSGTGFTNLSQYIGANQNNQLGNTVSAGVQQAGQAATGAVNQAGQDFNTQAQTEQGRLQGLGQTVTNTLGNLGNVTSSDINNFQTAESGKGQGPTGLANTGDLQNKAQSAQQLGQATGTQAGRYGLLQQYVGRGQNYNIGQQGLDQTLLGNTGQKQLAQARASTSMLPGQTNQAINSAAAQGQELGNQAQQLAQNTQNQLGGAVTGYNTQMQNQLQNLQSQYQAGIAGLGTAPTNAAVNIDPNVLNQLSSATGGALKAGTNLYNVDPTQYLSLNQNYANAQGAQSQADYAKVQALGQLAGNSLAGTNAGTTLQQYLGNPSAVGEFAANPYSSSNNAALAAAISSAGSNYNNQLRTDQQMMQQNIDTGIGGGGNNILNVDGSRSGATGDQIGINDLRSMLALAQSDQSKMPTSDGQDNSSNPRISALQNAIADNQARQAQNQASITQLGQTFDINRILGASKPAVQATPVLGNNGQPLTS
jgi:hypothetical protein